MKVFRKARILSPQVMLGVADLAFDTHTRTVGTYDVAAEEMPYSRDWLIVPGFIDTHIHGAGGADTMDATPAAIATMADTLAREGTTSFLATTMTAGEEDTRRALQAVAEYRTLGRTVGARCLGVHMEGPCLSPVYAGAQPAAYMQLPQVEYFKRMNAAAAGCVRLVTMAPELTGAEDVIRFLDEQGILVNIGHSDAGEEDIFHAVLAGASGVTHTYNAQRPLHHREIGVVGSALMMDPLRCELIADGIHVSIPAINLLFKCKGVKQITLITDAMREKGLGDGVSELGGQTVYVKNGEARLADGTLAGSVATMNGCIRNLVKRLGISLADAVDCASLNPARALGLEDRYGVIREGAVADYTVLDGEMNVVMTIRDGEVVYRA